MVPATDVSLGDTPDGRRVEVSRELDTPAERAWEVLTDTERWPDWGPTVSAVDADRRFVRAGSTGDLQVLGGPWIPYEITSCEDYRWTWDVADVPATGHRVESVPHERCRVVFELHPLATGYAPVCARALQQIEGLVGGDRAADEPPEDTNGA